MTLKIMISDVSVRERLVELADNCPKCGVALREARLTGWEYQDQQRPLSVREDGTIDYEEDDENDCTPEGGESFLSYVTLVCQCGHFLAEDGGRFTPQGLCPTCRSITCLGAADHHLGCMGAMTGGIDRSLDAYVVAIVEATIAYDATGDHRHDGSPVPGDCIRCNLLAALPEHIANRVREHARKV